MATTEQWHNEVTASIGGAENYGKGILPNPWALKEPEWNRREEFSSLRDKLSLKIKMLFEPRFITSPPTCELMESLITMIGAKQILELGTCTGFGTLHMLRAIIGKEGAQVVSVDARPAWDRKFFESLKPWVQMMEGWTPEALKQLHGRQFDFVFVDSDHTVEHSQKELAALLPITHPGTMICFHDCPEWRTNTHRVEPPVRLWLKGLIKQGDYDGMLLPSPNQLDCEEEYGKGYDNRCNPGLAVLIRK